MYRSIGAWVESSGQQFISLVTFLVITLMINKKVLQSRFRLEFHYHITRNLEICLKLNLSHQPGLAARELPAGTNMPLASVLVNLELWSLLGWAVLEAGSRDPLTGTSVKGLFSLWPSGEL